MTPRLLANAVTTNSLQEDGWAFGWNLFEYREILKRVSLENRAMTGGQSFELRVETVGLACFRHGQARRLLACLSSVHAIQPCCGPSRNGCACCLRAWVQPATFIRWCRSPARRWRVATRSFSPPGRPSVPSSRWLVSARWQLDSTTPAHPWTTGSHSSARCAAKPTGSLSHAKSVSRSRPDRWFPTC